MASDDGGPDTTSIENLLTRIYSSIASQCHSDAVVGTQSTSLELFEGRKYRIMEQIAHPLRYQRAVVASEFTRFPEWAPDFTGKLTGWDRRMEQEWQTTDLIWVPARGLIEVSRECGADPRKFHVIPYPIAGRVPVTGSRECTCTFPCGWCSRERYA